MRNGNFFYTHSYIFNYGIPLKHTGALYGRSCHRHDRPLGRRRYRRQCRHAVLPLDGRQSLRRVPRRHRDQQSDPEPDDSRPRPYRPRERLCRGRLRVRAPRIAITNARQIYDVVTTYKPTDTITLANETNYIRDDLFHATAEGTALYGIYKLTDQWSFGARGEVFRDDQGFFVTSFQESQAFMNAERGIAVASRDLRQRLQCRQSDLHRVDHRRELVAGGALPLQVPSTLGLTLRPEVRWDHAFGLNPGVHPFGVTKTSGAAGTIGTKDDQFLLSVDAILAF